MVRGRIHDEDIRAEAIAMVVSGSTISDAARAKGVDKSLVSRWVAAYNREAVATNAARLRPREPDPQRLEALILDHVERLITAVSLQLSAATQPAWLAKQTARDLADLVVAERDTYIRLLAGFPPIEAPADQPGSVLRLDAPAPPDPAPD